MVDLYREAHLDPGAVIVQYDTWSEMAAALGRYQSIDRLVVLGHSNPGEFLFGKDPRTGKFREELLLDQAAERLQALGVRPQIRMLDLAGCNIGIDLDSVVQFGLAVGATQVVATNHFHEFQLGKLEGGPGLKDVEKSYLNMRNYITTPNVDKLVEQSKTRRVERVFLLEWYVGFQEEDKLDLPIGSNLHSKAQTDVFKQVSSAHDEVVVSPAGLERLKADFALFGFQEPIRRLIRVTLRLEGFLPPEGGRAQSPATTKHPDAGSPSRPASGQPDAGIPQRPATGQPDGGAPQRPATGRPGRSGRRLTADDPAGRAMPGPRPAGALDERDRAIVDEVFRRGGSVRDAMGLLFTRAHDKAQLGSTELQRALRQPSPSRGTSKPANRSAQRLPRFTLEDRALLENDDPEDRLQSELGKVEDLRPLVQARFDAYVEVARREFTCLSPFVQASFDPITKPPYADPIGTWGDKYIVLRGAYYRAGWTCIKRDVLDLIQPATFFGAPVLGGVHREMAEVLRGVEEQIRVTRPELALQKHAAGFVIGGFVPRFQAASSQLSNHALGLAIDIDATWNPQLKSPAARAALARATGDDIGRSLYAMSSIDMVAKTYDRVAAMSARLQEWLKNWLHQYEELARQRAEALKDPRGKEKVASIDKQIRSDEDLNAVATLVKEYTLRTVQSWQAYGIVTIPPEIIKAFLNVGSRNGARWGGQYDNTKDIMHLELLRLVRPDSLARPGAPGLRKPVYGFDDLRRGEAPPEPDCKKPAPPAAMPVAPRH